MTFLLDSNVWLDELLQRPRHAEVRAFLTAVPSTNLAIARYALHSIGLLISKRQPDVFQQFLDDLEQKKIAVLDLRVSEMHKILKVVSTHHLDFDDSFHYAIAEHFGLTIISFDAHFDRTPLGRKTPAQVMP